MLSKMIVNSYQILIEIALWLSLLAFVILGWQMRAGGFAGSIMGFKGAIIWAVVWFIVAVVFFGGLLVLGDIRERVKKIESSK